VAFKTLGANIPIHTVRAATLKSGIVSKIKAVADMGAGIVQALLLLRRIRPAVVVGFGGVLSGACVFKSGSSTAIKIAAHMTGMEFSEVDDTVKDGIGELCNMLAGAWKGKVPDLAANCGLSIPAVITGRDYHLHVQAPEFKLDHTYCFDGASFGVTIICDGLQ